jgi:3-oxo-5-alpha-steroid 4-dehydrogenase 1
MPPYPLFITIWITIAVFAGIYLLKIAAPYGRYVRPGWGPTISNRAGWIIMESTVIITFLAWKPWNTSDWKNPSNIMVALFLVHYLHRALIYPLRIRTRGKRMPLVIMLSAMLFNGVNGSLLGIWFAQYAHYNSGWYSSFPFIAGIILFFSGMAMNISSDNRLIALRSNAREPNSSSVYQIPYGGLFRLISSPNLLGEIMEWAGYALLTWSYPALAFLIWTCANLIPRTITNHRWYQKKFPDYPIGRKILIPWLW